MGDVSKLHSVKMWRFLHLFHVDMVGLLIYLQMSA